MEREILGLVAGAFTTFGFVPQLFRIFRRKSAKEISLPFTISIFVGMTLWLIYGVSFRVTLGYFVEQHFSQSDSRFTFRQAPIWEITPRMLWK